MPKEQLKELVEILNGAMASPECERNPEGQANWVADQLRYYADLITGQPETTVIPRPSWFDTPSGEIEITQFPGDILQELLMKR